MNIARPVDSRLNGGWNEYMKNCPNCGAPIEPYKCRCDYCHTWYFDFTAFDMSGNDPYYVKFRTPYGVITTLAKPELQTIEISEDTVDITDNLGRCVYRIPNPSRSCDLGVVFHSVANPEDGTLYTLYTEE